MKTLIIIGASPRSLVNFRGDLIRLFVDRGFKVFAVASKALQSEIRDIELLGAHYIDCPTKRTSINPFSDLRTMFFYRKIFLKIQPDYVISYTIKPVIWSGISLRGISKTQYFALVTGLGYAFDGRGFKRVLINKIASLLYKISLCRSKKVIFQNNDDLNYFVERNLVHDSKCSVIAGSGVPLDMFMKEPLPPTPITFLMVARLLKEKGFFEFVEAATIVKKKFPDLRFQLLGGFDSSPDGINSTILDKFVSQGYIEYLGETNDVRPYFANSHVFVLPSFYREGLPRTILEAMAIGRPILTTDNVGCREPVVAGLNGWLVPIQDSNALAERMTWFVTNQDKLEPMGLASRKIIEDKFDVVKVNASILEIMDLFDEKIV